MKKFLLTIIFSFIFMSLYAQMPNKGKEKTEEEDFEGFNVQKEAFSVVIGSLRDAQTKEPIEYASVSLIRTRDSSAVKGVITGSNGKFRLEQLPVGNYIALVTFVGYRKYLGKPFVIKSGSYKTDLGVIDIQPTSENLKEVEVTHTKATFEMHADKKVFNVDRNLTTTGGTAADVLKNVPSVTVDQNGNVSLRGRSNVVILIDNKPSNFGNDIATVLQQIPANAIESIEVITNPSAKYSATGTTGIINIVMKKNKLEGYNGVLIGGIGSNDEINNIRQENVTATFNFKTPKFTVSSVAVLRDSRHEDWSENKIDTALRKINRQIDTNFENNLMTFGRLSVDYNINAFNTIGANISLFRMINPISLSSSVYSYDLADRESYASQRKLKPEGDNIMYSISPGLTYRHTFLDPKHTIDVDLIANEFGRDANTIATDRIIPMGTIGYEKSGSIAKLRMYNAQADYFYPIKDGYSFESGYKMNSFDLDVSNDVFVKAPLAADYIKDNKRSSVTRTYTLENAVYATFSGKIKKFTYQLGLRAENAQKDIVIKKSNSTLDSVSFTKSYPDLFPSVFLTYNLKNERSIGLNYSRRVERPGFMQIMPITYYVNPKQLTRGNPDLEPEYTHSLEFNFSKTWDNESFNFTLYDYYKTNVVNYFRQQLGGDTTLTTFKNSDISNDIGIEMVLKNKIYKWWEITTSLNAYRNELNGNNLGLGIKTAYQGDIRVVSSFRPNWDWSQNTSLQLSAYYESRQTYIQGYAEDGFLFDFGVKKEWGEKKQYILNVNINDILNQSRTIRYTKDAGYDLFTYERYNARSISISFMYRFGKLDSSFFKKKKAKDDTMDRMGGGM